MNLHSFGGGVQESWGARQGQVMGFRCLMHGFQARHGHGIWLVGTKVRIFIFLDAKN